MRGRMCRRSNKFTGVITRSCSPLSRQYSWPLGPRGEGIGPLRSRRCALPVRPVRALAVVVCGALSSHLYLSDQSLSISESLFSLSLEALCVSLSLSLDSLPLREPLYSQLSRFWLVSSRMHVQVWAVHSNARCLTHPPLSPREDSLASEPIHHCATPTATAT